MEASEPVRWVRGWRRSALATGMLVYPLITAIGVGQYSHGAAAATGYAIVIVFGATYVLSGAAAVRDLTLAYWLLTACLFALFVAALPYAHENAFFLAAVLVSIVVMTHRRAGLGLLVAMVLAS